MTLSTSSISQPWKNLRSYYYLSGVFAYWAIAGNTGVLPLPSCPLRFLTGIPCPFCGITTGSSWLIQGEILEASRSNILVPLLGLSFLILGFYTIACRLVGGYSVTLNAGSELQRVFWVFAGLLVAISWSINLYRYS